jgi:uncharacterized protein YbbC (DUF1343 family)
LPNDRAIALYPSLCLFEGTVVSVGRGTEAPFQLAGHPGHPGRAFQFTPQPTDGAKEPMHKGQVCHGHDYRQTPNWPQPFSLQPLLEFYRQAPEKAKFFNAFFTKLAGGEALRWQIEQGMDEAAIRATWQPALDQYKALRKKYLLYPDFE